MNLRGSDGAGYSYGPELFIVRAAGWEAQGLLWKELLPLTLRISMGSQLCLCLGGGPSPETQATAPMYIAELDPSLVCLEMCMVCTSAQM